MFKGGEMKKQAFWEIFIPFIVTILIGIILLIFLQSCSFYYQYAEPGTFKGKAEVIKIEPDYAIVSAGYVREFWKLSGKIEMYLNYMMYQYQDGTFMVKKEIFERYDEFKEAKK